MQMSGDHFWESLPSFDLVPGIRLTKYFYPLSHNTGPVMESSEKLFVSME